MDSGSIISGSFSDTLVSADPVGGGSAFSFGDIFKDLEISDIFKGLGFVTDLIGGSQNNAALDRMSEIEAQKFAILQRQLAADRERESSEIERRRRLAKSSVRSRGGGTKVGTGTNLLLEENVDDFAARQQILSGQNKSLDSSLLDRNLRLAQLGLKTKKRQSTLNTIQSAINFGGSTFGAT